MSGDSYLRASAAQSTSQKMEQITTGFVVDTDDPQQNSRIRVACAAWGDEVDPTSANIKNIPWASMAPPLAGMMTQGYRGISSRVDGEVPYGFFGAPKLGAEAVVAMVNGDPGYRVVLGFLHDLGGTGAAPHGRFQTSGGYPDGPLTLEGTQIQPLYNNLTDMFGGPYGLGPRTSFEWMSRGSDYTYSAHRAESRNSKQSDDDPENVTITEPDGRTISYTAGYAKDRVGDQPAIIKDDDRTYDPQTYAWVSPGFHSYSMDDRPENCRVRIRTTTGHQIILDDTNERIYVSSNKGRNWVEMDSCGNIDIHSDTRISIHAANDINMTSEGTIRLASKDIHIRAQNEIRAYSNADTHIYANANLRVRTTQKTFIETGSTFEVLATADAKITSSANVHVLAASSAFVTGSSSVEIMSSGNILETASMIYSNSGPAASPADTATPSQSKTAYHTNRIPMHEPWPRVLTDKAKSDKDDALTPIPVMYTTGTLADFEFKTYNDPNIGRIEYGTTLNRNAKWHR